MTTKDSPCRIAGRQVGTRVKKVTSTTVHITVVFSVPFSPLTPVISMIMSTLLTPARVTAELQTIMNLYVQRTHGTYLENKGSALLWQFRDADPEFGWLQSKELEDHLTSVLKPFR